MTFDKMRRVIQTLNKEGTEHGSIYSGMGAELRFSMSGQPSLSAHRYLLKYGFVCVDGDYIYRPRSNL